MRRTLLMLALLLAIPQRAGAYPVSPVTQDPLGPLSDVTDAQARYQAADTFCVAPDGFEASGGLSGTSVTTTTAADPLCASSGFTAEQASVPVYVVSVQAPPLCGGCRRLFIDYSRIPAANDPPSYYAYGHSYFRLSSLNPAYTIEATAHSPNIKNVTNDKLVVPDDAPYAPAAQTLDLHLVTYTGNTWHTDHTQMQGPYYAGPWYVNREGVRIHGAYVDVDPSAATRLPDASLNEIRYWAAFNSGGPTCPDNDAPFAPAYQDGNYWYGGCVDHFGTSETGVDPFA